MSQIKKCLVSRFYNGSLVEADYKQLEVFALAFLSDDKQLKEDLLNGVDIHSVNASELYGIPLAVFLKLLADGDTKAVAQRKLTKRLSFQLQYGASANTLASKNNIPISTAKKFISNYYGRYPQVKVWQDEQIKCVSRNRIPSVRRTDSGTPAGKSVISSITGRLYHYYEEDSSYKSTPTFSPTAIKNYPVQGLATGDIVPMVLGRLFNMIYDNEWQDHVLLVNTIHDSVLFDVHPDYLVTAVPRIKEVMENAPTFFKEDFGITFDLPLNVDIKYGPNWAEMKPYDNT